MLDGRVRATVLQEQRPEIVSGRGPGEDVVRGEQVAIGGPIDAALGLVQLPQGHLRLRVSRIELHGRTIRLGGRVAPVSISEAGEARFSPLPRGRYCVGIDREGIFTTVEVTGPGATAELPGR